MARKKEAPPAPEKLQGAADTGAGSNPGAGAEAGAAASPRQVEGGGSDLATSTTPAAGDAAGDHARDGSRAPEGQADTSAAAMLAPGASMTVLIGAGGGGGGGAAPTLPQVDLERVRVLSPVDVDGERFEPDAEPEIRAELVADLVACGAVERVTD